MTLLKLRKISLLAGTIIVLAGLVHGPIVSPSEAHGEKSGKRKVSRESFPGAAKFDPEAAYKYSQSVVGKSLGNHSFIDTDGKSVNLEQFRGDPLIISMVFSSCFDICPAVTINLASAVDAARKILPDKKFNIISVGFDTLHDTPAAMKLFARQYNIGDENWRIASGEPDAVEHLAADTGFIYFASPRGFDHLIQTTVVNAEGKIDSQIYGENFEATRLVEPLKQLYFGGIASVDSVESFVNRVRLFCTIYDPTEDTYRFDYSFFIGMALSAFVLFLMGNFVVRNIWRLWFADPGPSTNNTVS